MQSSWCYRYSQSCCRQSRKTYCFCIQITQCIRENYSELDREALDIIFEVTHFYNYLFARHVILVTDNQPLYRIFHHQKALLQMIFSRLLRYTSFLVGFNYSVQFKNWVNLIKTLIVYPECQLINAIFPLMLPLVKKFK